MRGKAGRSPFRRSRKPRAKRAEPVLRAGGLRPDPRGFCGNDGSPDKPRVKGGAGSKNDCDEIHVGREFLNTPLVAAKQEVASRGDAFHRKRLFVRR